MTLLQKRILILFSITLNIGFVIMALILVFQHSVHVKKNSTKEFTRIIQQLNLPPEQAERALANLTRFHAAMDSINTELNQARGNTMLLLGSNGPVDPNQLHMLVETADRLATQRGQLFEAHVLELRDILGDEKGAEFFETLHQHIKSHKMKRD